MIIIIQKCFDFITSMLSSLSASPVRRESEMLVFGGETRKVFGCTLDESEPRRNEITCDSQDS